MAKILIISCLLLSSVHAQPVTDEDLAKTPPSVKRLFLLLLNKLDSTRNELSLIEPNYVDCLSRDTARQLEINAISNRLIEKDTQITILNNIILEKDKIPLFKFHGFYGGISATYGFNDSVISKQTLLSGLKYDLTGTVKVSLNGNFDLSALLGIPLRRESMYLKINADYKIF